MVSYLFLRGKGNAFTNCKYKKYTQIQTHIRKSTILKKIKEAFDVTLTFIYDLKGALIVN